MSDFMGVGACVPPAESVSVIIIAGGKDKDGLAESQGVTHHSLIEFSGKSIIARTIDSFLGVTMIDEIVVVGVPDVLAALPDKITKINSADTAVANIELGLKSIRGNKVVICPADVPWLTSEALSDFVAEALQADAEIVYPIVSQDVYNARFGGGRRTYVKLKEGTFTGANLVLADSAFLESLLPLIHQLFEHRKNPVALARILGIGFVLKMLTHRLDLSSIESRASKIVCGKAVALPIDRAELAFDIDSKEDLEAALKLLKQH